MRDKPNTLHDLLRAAIRSQVDLGMGEMIVNRANVRPAAVMPSLPDPATLISRAGETPIPRETRQPAPEQPARLFADSKHETPAPKYSSLEEHRAAICDCRKCPLADSRTKFVYGVGNPKAELMFVGEAPGRDEDLKGEPFVGAAGQLLDKIIGAMHLSRSDVYIANVLKCRPPNNRDPLPEEIDECLPHLQEQIRIIRPKVLCALGRIAGQALLNTKTPLGKLRRVWHEYEGIPLLVTYHPAALLRFPVYKKDVWEDMQLVMAKLDEMRK